MRRLTFLLALLVVAVNAGPASAQSSCFSQLDELGRTKGVICGGEVVRELAPASASPARSKAGPTTPLAAPPPPAAEDVGIRAQFGRTETGEQCVGLVDVVGPGEATSPASVQAEQVFLRSLATMAPCTGPEALPVIASTPAIEAARFWRDMDLPELAPQIQPGKALVGLTAFLETGGEPTAGATGETPFGPLTITARRAVTVDWDDGPGSVSGPHGGVGGPYPDGDITWRYGRSGPRDVVVTQTWTATWSIGDTVGTFSGRGTSSTISAFPVEEVQAVRNR